jgi:hypothetical protein
MAADEGARCPGAGNTRALTAPTKPPKIVIPRLAKPVRGTQAELTIWYRRLGPPDQPSAAREMTTGGRLEGRNYSIDGMTRSGGRCPSMKVLMLTMTFSPMSMRPSTVAEPMWGSSTTLGSFMSLGLMAGSCS